MPEEERDEQEQPIQIAQAIKDLVEEIKYVARKLDITHELASVILEGRIR